MAETWERFPTDEMNLTLLEAACNINEDTGHTELQRFLEMTGGPITSVTMNGIVYDSVDEALADVDDTYDAPVLEIKREPGHEPHSEHTVIVSLIEEIRRLRMTTTQETDMTEEHYILVSRLTQLRTVALLLGQVFPLEGELLDAYKVVKSHIRLLEVEVEAASDTGGRPDDAEH